MTSLKNIPASVRQRLLNLSRKGKRPFNELLQYYAIERFLYRLSKSIHSERFILKGALMLRVWGSPEARPTMDIDMLGKTSNDEARIIDQIRDILAVKVENDGLIFDPESIQTDLISEDSDYEGIRIRFRGKLDSAKVSIQIDIGFGDIVYPNPKTSDFPTILESPTPRILCYSRESVIAEKFEAMINLGLLNSRMKDFYDIWLLSRQFNFEGALLAEAIRLTLKQRGTPLPIEIEAFTDSFATGKQAQWTAFWKRLQQDQVPMSFREITFTVKEFLEPLVSSFSSNNRIPTFWIAPGPWHMD